MSKNIDIKTYGTIILPVFLYGSETCFATLREEQRLRVFREQDDGRMFGPKRCEVTGDYRRLQIEELDGCTSH